MLHRALLILPLAALAAVPGGAQPLRSAVVPSDAAVVIPPRGQPVPVPTTRSAASEPPPPMVAPPGSAPAGAAAAGLGLVPAMVLPFAAGVLLGGGLPGSGSSAAPATTTR